VVAAINSRRTQRNRRPIPDLAPNANGQAQAAQPSRKKSFIEDSAYIRVAREVGQHSDLRRHLIQQLEKDFQAKVVTYFTSFDRFDVEIDDTDAEIMESVLAAEADGRKIILIINSPGGQALAAERIVNVCRSYSNNQFEALIPHAAKSAATMICFGASKLHMSPTAELGPVDPQVPYWSVPNPGPEDRPRWISAEEYLRSYEDLIREASNGKAQRIEPFIQQLGRYDARYMEQLRSLRALSADISVRLLQSDMMKGRSTKAIQKAIDVFLTQKKTSSHGRMINSQEAKTCGLNVTQIALNSTVWHCVWELFIRSKTAVDHCGKLIETAESAIRTGSD
jgi:ATP-dependent protease ClpP protease subunit